MTTRDAATLNAEASVLMKRGIHLMGDSRPETIAEALDCFDRARELRTKLPIDSNPMLLYGLAACWLNRAEALIRLGQGSRMTEAIEACNEGIALSRRLPVDSDPKFARRLAAALQNRGIALQMWDGQALPEALASLQEAITVLDLDAAQSIPDRRLMLAAVWMNISLILVSRDGAAVAGPAKDAAQRSLGFVEGLEQEDANAAETGLKARHIICRILTNRLGLLAAQSNAAVPEDVHEATDLVDNALHLVRQWERKGVSRFRSVALDLFRFGARVYARFQPQFLSEFVLENLDASRSSPEYAGSQEMCGAAEEALRLPYGRPGPHPETGARG